MLVFFNFIYKIFFTKGSFIIFKNKYGEIRSGWDILWISTISFIGIGTIINTFYFIIIRIANLDSENLFLESNDNTDVILSLLTDFFGIIFLLFIWKFYIKKNFKDMGFSKIKFIKKFLLGLLFGLLSIGTAYFLFILFKIVKINSIDYSYIYSKDFFIYLFLFIIVGFFEETLSRGCWMSILKRTRNLKLSIFVSSFLFAVIHLMNPNTTLLGIFNIFLVGIVFSFMLIKTGSIWMSIGFHITWNFFQGNIFGLNVSGLNMKSLIYISITGNDLLTGGNFGAEGSIIVTFLLLILIFIFSFLVKPSKDLELWYFFKKQ